MTVTKACRLYAGLTQQELGMLWASTRISSKTLKKCRLHPAAVPINWWPTILACPAMSSCRMISPLSRQASLLAGRSRHMHLSLWKITSVSAAKGRNLS